MSRWVITMPFDLASKNSVARNHHARAARRNQFAAALSVVARDAGIPIGPTVPQRRVTITRIYAGKQRPFDGDGLQAGDAVLLRDAMQLPRKYKRKGVTREVFGASIIRDDGPFWADFHYRQEPSTDGRPAVRIEIEDL